MKARNPEPQFPSAKQGTAPHKGVGFGLGGSALGLRSFPTKPILPMNCGRLEVSGHAQVENINPALPIVRKIP